MVISSTSNFQAIIPVIQTIGTIEYCSVSLRHSTIVNSEYTYIYV